MNIDNWAVQPFYKKVEKKADGGERTGWPVMYVHAACVPDVWTWLPKPTACTPTDR